VRSYRDMPIRYLETSILYENPRPLARSRHGYFPGLARLPSGKLIALFVIAEAFESADATTWVARSADGGRTWALEAPLFPQPTDDVRASDYLKPTVLRDGTVVAIGYRFYRDDPEQGIGIQETGGIQPGDDIISFSSDEGRTWSAPEVIPRTWPELFEISGPCVQIRSGELLALGALTKLPDGSNPSGQRGILLRSGDGGRSWNDSQTYFVAPRGNMMPLEARLCEMEDGRLIAIAWTYDYDTDRHLPNHIVVSHDAGRSWSAPADTGHMGQAASVMAWTGDRLLSIHAHRGEENPGIYVRAVDFAGDRWKPLEEIQVYRQVSGTHTHSGQNILEMFAAVRFGQPSLLNLENGEVLATHWCVEDGQGKIRLHRLLVEI